MMGVATLGRVLVEAKVTNLTDALAARAGTVPADEVRSVNVPDALLDTGATLLAMPPDLIQRLGLIQTAIKRTRTAGGLRELGVYDAVRLEIQGRECTVEVREIPEGSPVLIGQIPL